MSNTNTSPRIIRFYQSNVRLLKANWSSLFAFLLLLPFVFYRRSQNKVMKTLSFLSTGLFLLYMSFFIPLFYRMLFHMPIIEINEQGISFNPYVPWFIKLKMSMRWEEIAALYVDELTIRGKKRTRTNRFLAVVPKDEEAYFQREKMLDLRRAPALVLWSATKTPFMVFEQMTTPTSSHDLLTLITRQFSDKIQANGIEIRDEQKTVIPRRE